MILKKAQQFDKLNDFNGKLEGLHFIAGKL